MKLLPVESVQKRLIDILKKSNEEYPPSKIKSLLEKVISDAQSSQEAAQSLFEFSETKKTEKLLRIISADIPSGILESGYAGTLHDIRVNGYGPDDEIFSKHPDIRQKIPRGFTLMKMCGDEEWLDVMIYANKKFTGSIGDEDDVQNPINNELWKEYFIKDYETATQVISVDKINGEAAHFSGRYINGQFYLIAGSKNVHLIIRKKEDIDLYQGDRYNVAKVVATVVWETLEGLTPENRHLVYSLLHHTKCTAVAEILQPDYQHIVSLSHFSKPQLYVFVLTPTANAEEDISLLAIPPHHTLQLLSALGFTTPAYTEVHAAKVSQHKDKIRYDLHKEGEVLYFLDAKNETIGLVKAKTAWYIMMRALREKAAYCFLVAKKHKNWTLEDYVTGMDKRFANIQNWLKFSNSYLKAWKELGATFLHWMDKELREHREVEGNLRPTFPILWEKFLSETKQTDKIALQFN